MTLILEKPGSKWSLSPVHHAAFKMNIDADVVWGEHFGGDDARHTAEEVLYLASPKHK
jgi:hypothetical protein